MPHDRRLDLCHYCEAALPWASGGSWIGGHRFDIPAIDAVLAPLHYHPPIPYWVSQLKFHGVLRYGRLLGELLNRWLQDHPQADWEQATVVPIPLHPRRLRRRGFNQAQVLARPLIRSRHQPPTHRKLVRQLHRPPQHQQNREVRRRNLQGAFRSQDWAGARVVLLDDVITTGATANAAATACRNAGASAVALWCIAQTPKP